MTPTIHIPNTGHPWSTVYAVAAANISESWLLTGGLMVQLHAIMGGLTARPTTDADLLADLMTDRRGIARLRGVLAARGFETQPGTLTGYTTRMSAPNGDVVDLLVADHLPKFLGTDATSPARRCCPCRAARRQWNAACRSDSSTTRAMPMPDSHPGPARRTDTQKRGIRCRPRRLQRPSPL